MIESEECSPPPSPRNTEAFNCQRPLSTERKKNKNKNKNNRRFSNEQIRSLESLFKLETKLEPRKKLQMARELGLQPRQVAIWFQNRRARWKSKQIEQEYRALKADYDDLSSRFESLKKEKNSLLIQFNRLCDQLKKHDDGGSKDLEGNSTETTGSETGDTKFELKGLHGGRFEQEKMTIYSDEDERRNKSYLAKEALDLGEEINGFSKPAENGSNCELDGLFDHSVGTSDWWDFWS